jgi:hypothetical protein
MAETITILYPNVILGLALIFEDPPHTVDFEGEKILAPSDVQHMCLGPRDAYTVSRDISKILIYMVLVNRCDRS